MSLKILKLSWNERRKLRYKTDKKYRENILKKQREWNLKNTKKHRESAKKWCKLNPERKKQHDKQYHILNKEKRKLNHKKWRDNNPFKSYDYMMKHFLKFSNSPQHLRWLLASWSKAVKHRDNNICQVCGSKYKIIAHHILHKAKYPNLMLNLNNGITLCHLCHYNAHGGVFKD